MVGALSTPCCQNPLESVLFFKEILLVPSLYPPDVPFQLSEPLLGSDKAGAERCCEFPSSGKEERPFFTLCPTGTCLPPPLTVTAAPAVTEAYPRLSCLHTQYAVYFVSRRIWHSHQSALFSFLCLAEQHFGSKLACPSAEC